MAQKKNNTELSPEEKRRARNRRYYQKNRAQLRQRQAQRYHALTVDQRAKEAFRSARFRTSGSSAHVPTWNDLDEACRVYIAAWLMTDLAGEKYVVDHIVPLNHPLVCGLHCHNNLTVLRQPENLAKDNLFWPDMPCVDWESWKMIEKAQFQ